MNLAAKARDTVERSLHRGTEPDTRKSYQEMLDVIQRLYDLTGQLDLKDILERAKRASP